MQTALKAAIMRENTDIIGNVLKLTDHRNVTPDVLRLATLFSAFPSRLVAQEFDSRNLEYLLRYRPEDDDHWMLQMVPLVIAAPWHALGTAALLINTYRGKDSLIPVHVYAGREKDLGYPLFHLFCKGCYYWDHYTIRSGTKLSFNGWSNGELMSTYSRLFGGIHRYSIA